MKEKYEELHEAVLCVLHDLMYGEFGLRGDPKERVLRSWYAEHHGFIEEAADKAIYQPPTCSGRDTNPSDAGIKSSVSTPRGY